MHAKKPLERLFKLKVRTRIALPQLRPHVGTAYVALFNMLFAKVNKGDFILRIEIPILLDRKLSTRNKSSHHSIG